MPTHKYRSPLRPLDYGWTRSACEQAGTPFSPNWDETTIGEWTKETVYAFDDPLPEGFVQRWDLEELDAFEAFSTSHKVAVFVAPKPVRAHGYTFYLLTISSQLEGPGEDGEPGLYSALVRVSGTTAEVSLYEGGAGAARFRDLQQGGEGGGEERIAGATAYGPNRRTVVHQSGHDEAPVLWEACRAANLILARGKPS